MKQIRIDNVEAFNYYESNGTPTEDQNIKLSEDDKRWLVDIGNAVSEATGNSKYGASSVAREAIKFYRTFYQFRHKILKYRKALIAWLSNLP